MKKNNVLIAFNPYFTGYSSNADLKYYDEIKDKSFNPYFTGYSSNAEFIKTLLYAPITFQSLFYWI